MKLAQLVPSSMTYGCLLQACVKNNDIQTALEVFNTMKADRVQMNTVIYTTMIKAYQKSYQLEKALEIYETMLKEMKTNPNSAPNIVTFNSLLDCCVRCFDVAQATQIFHQMLDPTAPASCRPDLITYSIMIKGYCKDKNIEQAFVTLQLMEKTGIKADFALYKSLMIGCCKNNQMEMALKVYENMRLLGIKPTDVYRLEKKGGPKRHGKHSVSFEFEKSLEEQKSDDDYLHDFHRICNLYRGPRPRPGFLF